MDFDDRLQNGYSLLDNSIEDNSEDAYYYCDVCHDRFNSPGALNFHKTSFHYDKWKDDPKHQYDVGQNDLRDGVVWLWSQFKEEHDLPDVIFAYEQEPMSDNGRKLQNKTIMPLYFKDKAKDLRTGLRYDVLSLGYQWKLLDPYAKASTLAHMASHIEIIRAVDQTSAYAHSRRFKRIAESYDMEVAKVNDEWCATYANAKFKKKHRGPMRLICRYHPIEMSHGRASFSCNLEKRSEAFMHDIL